MNKRILFGQISPAQLMFDPPVGNGQGEGGTGQTQQQQQPADPFADVDIDLLPDNARAAITQARSSLQSLQSQSANASQHQTRAQQLEAELTQVRQQLEARQGTSPQLGAKPEPTTQEGKLEAYYIANGIPETQAKNIAKMNKGAFEIFAEDIRNQMGQQFAPIAGQVIANTAEDAFHAAAQNDRVGWSQVQEIQQNLWDRVQNMAKAGQMVNGQVVENLAKILWYDHVQANGGGQPQQQQTVVPFPNQNQPHNIPVIGNQNFQQQSRFSYPGAGNVTTPRNQQGSGMPVIDAETQAAINATTGSWDPKLQEALKRKTGTNNR